MASRKLSHNQTRRVNQLQQQRLARAVDAGASGSAERHGVVIARFGRQAAVEDPAAPQALVQCHIRANIDSLVAGDRVAWCVEGDAGVVLAVEPRSSVLQRPDAQGRLRPIAANLDHIVVVLAPEPQPHPTLLDRYLVAAEDAGIDATILLNKSDLADACAHVAPLLAPYAQIGYRVLQASAHASGGMAALGSALSGRTTAFVGQSGVGKSSLIAALLPAEQLRIGELSGAEVKGRHTTTTARLYHLPLGGVLIDSPGIRDFSLAFLDTARTARGFREFRSYLGSCRFRDCVHRNEPGCVLREAVARGRVSEARYRSYLQILGDPA
jgi:ribosome biogenesis GTPase